MNTRNFICLESHKLACKSEVQAGLWRPRLPSGPDINLGISGGNEIPFASKSAAPASLADGLRYEGCSHRLSLAVVAYPDISLVCFNGRKAAGMFEKLVLNAYDDLRQGMRFETLPSSSPAYASMPFAEKLEKWSIGRSPGLSMREGC